MAELEVQKNKENIKNSVTIEKENDVTDFIAELNTAENEKGSDKTTIATGAKFINKVVGKDVFNKGGEYKTYKEKVVEAFNDKGEKVLKNIKDNVTTKINDVDRNDQTDNTVININVALQAFTKDIAEYSEKGETLSTEIVIIEEIKKLITDKQTAVKKEQNNKMDADAMLNTIPTPELAIQLFDNSDPEIYNAMIAQIVGEKTDPIQIKPAGKKPTEEELKIGNLYKRIEIYMESANIAIKDIGDIKVGKPSDSFGSRYKLTNIPRVIEYKNQNKKNEKDEIVPQYIIHGSHEHLQEELAKANENTELAPDKIIALDKKTRAERLNAFDDIGNYALFNKYLEKKGDEYVKANLTGILQAINVYTPGKGSIDEMDNQLNVFKNGYANTFTDYVITHSDVLLESYANQLTEKNMNVFGADQSTRITNFNKIVNKLNDTLIWKKLSKTKQEELIRIISKIEDGEAPGSAAEVLSKGLDGMIKAFGPLLFNVLKFFGIGKATMMKLPGMKDRVKSMFYEEHKLSSEQIGDITEISKEFSSKNSESTLDTAKKIKDTFKDDKKRFINLFVNQDKDGNDLAEKKDYYKNININIIKAGLKTYNKTKDKNTTIDNIITTEKDNDTGKEYIASIKDKDTFKNALESILEKDEIWKDIHNANVEIQTKNKDNAEINEHNMTIKDAERYIIKTNQDIARYLTASLFSTKDLAYVMTENSLHNGSEIQNNTPEPNPSEILTFDETYVNADGKVINDSKMIHEVIDMTAAPDKIKITRADGQTTVNCTLKIDYDNTADTKFPQGKTYIDNNNNRVEISVGDKIEVIETTTKNPEELALEAFTNNRNKINGSEGTPEVKKESDKIMYDMTFDIGEFTYNATATEKQKSYQDNILIPLETVMNDKDQYKTLIENLADDAKKTTYETLFTNPIHLANMLDMMNNKNNNTNFSIAIDMLKKTSINDIYTVNVDKKAKTITIEYKENSTKKGEVILSQDNKNKLQAVVNNNNN